MVIKYKQLGWHLSNMNILLLKKTGFIIQKNWKNNQAKKIGLVTEFDELYINI